MQGRIRFGPKKGINTHAKSCASPIVSGPQPVCQACQTQFSRYTCPSCNFHYCTLTCYRSPSHSTCSEAFDRQSLVDEIRSSQGTNREEQKAMMEMLKRFEKEQGQENEAEEDDEVTTQRMLDKLKGVDLDSIEPSQLLEYLSPAQRAEFEDLLQVSTKVEALMEAHDELKKPWWEETEGVVVEEDEENKEEENAFTKKKTIRPAILPPDSLPPLKLGEDGRPLVDPGLLNNIVAVLLAYVYVVRTYSLSSLSTLIPSTMDHQEVYRVLLHLVPFLTTHSTFIFSSIKEPIENLFKTESQEDPSTIFQITQDVAHLLTPLPVINVHDHPFSNALTALADLETFFGSFTRAEGLNTKGIKAEVKQASMKLRFYYAFLARLGEGDSVLRSLGEEVERVGRGVAGMWEMKRIESERKGMEGKQRSEKVVGERRGPIIEEIAEEEGDRKVKVK
ncbi:BQ5605_C013g07328 [Microbotryum silenes-dioicae]|uniref:BQ5605_C013g07328 protein n=1 Tax=Microbotryum silenes-dioicae TaxID=796604 RepID=A0A2X0NVS2_9BASI|nr:BQ5605_C013g07328 [Microbotryum silenes-dioicae]